MTCVVGGERDACRWPGGKRRGMDEYQLSAELVRAAIFTRHHARDGDWPSTWIPGGLGKSG